MTDTPKFNDKHDQFAVERRALYVIQHTDAEYLGLIEDHLEGRSIGFTYMRPHTTGGHLPATVKFTDGVVLLEVGPGVAPVIGICQHSRKRCNWSVIACCEARLCWALVLAPSY